MNKKNKTEEFERTLVDLIQEVEIDDQGQLQQMLEQKGFVVSQATLSRLIKKLEIVKKAGRYVLLNRSAAPGFKIVSIKSNDSGIVMIKTSPGQAQGVAAFLDHKYGSEEFTNPLKTIFLGTIAGDDTVLVVLSSAKEAEKSIQLIEHDFL